jgi:hypothetical protein
MRIRQNRWIRKAGLFCKPGQRSIAEWLSKEAKKDER